MPSKGTARRAVRVDDDLWTAALAKAAAEGTDVSAVIRTALTRYVAKAPRKRRLQLNPQPLEVVPARPGRASTPKVHDYVPGARGRCSDATCAKPAADPIHGPRPAAKAGA